MKLRALGGYGLLIIGAGLFAASALADFLWFGNDMGFGERQIFGALAGMGMAILGMMVLKDYS